MITNSNRQDSSGLLTKVLPSYFRIAQIEILVITGFCNLQPSIIISKISYGSKTILTLLGNSNSTSRCDRPNLINRDHDMYLFSVGTGLRSLLYVVA